MSMLRASANQRSRTHSPHTLREAAVVKALLPSRSRVVGARPKAFIN